MENYIALLRGINVGGKNKVPMPILRGIFEDLGFEDVSTYINSGNVIFSSESQDVGEIRKKCETAIMETFNLQIPVLIVSAYRLNEIIQAAPDWWNIDKDAINYTIFIIPPMTVEEVLTTVGEIKPEYEQIAHCDDVIFWTTPRSDFRKTQWAKIASSAVNNDVTIRSEHCE